MNDSIETICGRITEVVLVKFAPGADLRRGIFRAIKENGINSGVVMSITGVLEKAVLERFHQEDGKTTMKIINVPGPMEVSGHGIIGIVDAPEMGDRPFCLGDDFVHGEPYLHVHLTVTTARETLCGHLLDGSTVTAVRPESHFTIMIGRIEGAMIKMKAEPGNEQPGNFRMLGHELTTF